MNCRQSWLSSISFCADNACFQWCPRIRNCPVISSSASTLYRLRRSVPACESSCPEKAYLVDKRGRIRAIFNLISYTNGPSPLSKNTPPKPISLSVIGYVPKSEIIDSQWNVVLLQWYTVTACSIVFFFCFATGEFDKRSTQVYCRLTIVFNPGSETVKFYHRVLRAVFPCIPERKPPSFDTLHTAR
jgi:hypothetical protein